MDAMREGQLIQEVGGKIEYQHRYDADDQQADHRENTELRHTPRAPAANGGDLQRRHEANDKTQRPMDRDTLGIRLMTLATVARKHGGEG